MMFRRTVWRVVLTATVLLAAAPSARQATQKPPQSPPTDKPWPEPAVMADRKREAERRRLFRSNDPLPVRLKADFRAVNRDRDPKSEVMFPATIEFSANDGSTVSVPLKIRTRGHSRRNAGTCSFAPLLLEFDKATVRNTVFDGHGPIKLGTHCRKGSEDVVLREHVLYRAFNLLTPRSFRTRVAKMTYVDASTGKVTAEEAGLFIEDDDDVAKRMEGRIIALENATFPRVERDTLALVMLFEYLIGNTDLSLMVQHNMRLVQTQDTVRYPVPYDWDYSGVVGAGYAVPARGLPITDVRDRLYRGPCRTLAEWQPVFEKFRAAKPKILAEFDAEEGLTPSYKRTAKNYLESGFRVFESPAMVKKELIDTCQKIGM
ncbi:MAG TPA: hypothetical protein VN700_11765 [Vicinamibacterales bacterium]|nr:hypothetical protein [Vicinamibacterales bacterium]